MNIAPISSQPRLKLRAILIWLGWFGMSLIAWLGSVVEVKGKYPDWDEDAGHLLGWFSDGALIIVWSIWLFWLSCGRSKQLYSWFRIGVCLALFLSIVRCFFMAEVVKLLHL